jgi:hypothetical protein
LWELNLLLKLVEIVERNRPSVRNSQRISSDFYHLHIVRSKHRLSRPFPSHINNRPFEPPSYRIGGQTYGLPNLHLKLSKYLNFFILFFALVRISTSLTRWSAHACWPSTFGNNKSCNLVPMDPFVCGSGCCCTRLAVQWWWKWTWIHRDSRKS